MPTVEVNGTTLAYEDAGPRDGVPLLLAHSLFFHRGMFAPLVAALMAELGDGYRCISYDHRGQGESAAAPLAELDMDTLTEDAAALIRALGLGRVHVVGNSMGGFVALRLAARHPELLRSAVALGSSAEPEHKLAEFAPLVAQLQAGGAAGLVDVLMHIMFGDASLAAGTPATAQWRSYMAGLPAAIGDAAHQVIHRRSVVDELAGTAVPVLAIAGAQDHAYPPPISSANIAAATGGRHVTVAAAGHSVALEQPAAVAAHLREHVAAVDAALLGT